MEIKQKHWQGMTNQFDEDYFMRGKESGKSLYENYRWLPDLTIPMARTIASHLGMSPGDRVLDFGCSRGYLVRALVGLGYDAYGVDISDWAIANCDETVLGRVHVAGSEFKGLMQCDWIISKDVMEHLTPEDANHRLFSFSRSARRGVFIVVPLSDGFESSYVVPEYEQDVTHKIRWPMQVWAAECIGAFGPKYEVSARYRIKGIKDNYSQFDRGNGFITIRKII